MGVEKVANLTSAAATALGTHWVHWPTPAQRGGHWTPPQHIPKEAAAGGARVSLRLELTGCVLDHHLGEVVAPITLRGDVLGGLERNGGRIPRL